MYSLAIETSCRRGGAALGRDDQLVEVVEFDASARHASQLIPRIDALLTAHSLRPGDIAHLYVSAGPGSFTGLRIGVTTARTLAQALPALRLVSVPTTWAVAHAAVDRARTDHLAVVLDAREGDVYVEAFERRGGTFVPAGPAPAVMPASELLSTLPRPITLTGEGLGYHPLAGEGVELLDEALWLPTAEAVWQVGRRLAAAGRFVDYHQLLPTYTRAPKAVRQWECR